MGRNYDYRHFNADKTSYVPTSAILVHTAPQGGKKSISMVDGLNMGYGKGFYTDGNTDLSLLMGLPYAALDGINEDGFADEVEIPQELHFCDWHFGVDRKANQSADWQTQNWHYRSYQNASGSCFYRKRSYQNVE